MSDKPVKTFVANIPCDKKGMEKFQQVMDTLADASNEHAAKEAAQLNISSHDMESIQYLRTRSRWTQEKEDHLIRLAKAGEKLPNVLSGEF